MAFLRNIPHNTLTDKELVALYKESGDMSVLGELYQRYMELVYGVCLKYYKEPEASKDAVMQIFEELVSKLKKHEVDNFKGWLHQVAKNHCLMQLRTPRNMKTVEFNTELMQSEENLHLNGVLEKEEHFKMMEFCLGTLTDKQQEAIRLFYLEGKCYNEITEMTGQDWNQVRSLIQNGRRNLKNCMEKNETAVRSV
ncbi:MAG: sigma-70 family RNA polymerase sigma factor [Chitinophagaceae bacterium]|nr:sigma-70 family RNA polymerase sigma factor [Chitinophagaceae bacterium]MBP8243292.1 sigma-70 family RNA polymerase sigma factor [Chitinophagaceae bacterium]